MSLINVETRDGVTSFRPGDVVEGRAWWQIDPPPPTEVVARLFWYTQGKGTQDIAVVAEEPFAEPGVQDQRKFSFRLPAGPFSFSGKLISLVWAIEVVAQPGGDSARFEFTVSPTGEEIRLVPVSPPSP
ncbi:MAG TPA: hypothetical protein VE078_06365 [Thermoanaerobaculia bacterium]|nr:hypothetical protein [Thermoanaerobaculia bacterium]